MCGTLNFENKVYRQGDMTPVKGPHGLGEAKWSGFVRADKMEWWKKEADAVSVEPLLESFSEGQANALHNVSGKLQAVGFRKNAKLRNGETIGERGDLRIITRSAITEYERETHSRWPVVLCEVNGSTYVQTWSGPDADALAPEDEAPSEGPQPF